MPDNKYALGDNEKSSTNDFDRGGRHGMGRGEKAGDFTKAIQQLVLYCQQYLPLMSIAIIFAVFGTALNIIGPGKLAEMTDIIADGLFTGIDMHAVAGIAFLLAVLYSVGFLSNLLQGIMMVTVTQKITKSLRKDLFSKINRLPLCYFDNTSIGNTLSRMTNDVDTIGQTLNQSFGALVTAVIMFFGAFFMMLYTNWIMTFAGVAAAALGFALMLLIISRSQKYFVQQQSELGVLNGHIEESYAGHNVVKAYNGETAAKQIFCSMNKKLYACTWKSQAISGLMQPLMSFTGNLDYVVVCVVGAILVVNSQISFGVIVAFMLYIRYFTQSLSQLAQVANTLQSAAAASERVFQFLNEKELEEENENKRMMLSARGDVDFENVRFGYQADKSIIHNFSIQVEAGQKIAIVGPTGAGKTTLVNLLMRFYEVQNGEIRIDGIPISQLSRKNLHSLFCMVLQDTWLFEGTIKENIIYAKENVTEEQVIATCKAVGLHHFIQTLPEGYDTVLNDNASLSAGQKQLITIARAMIEDAPMLILDEATSSVDTRTEMLIQQAMDQLMAGRTSFVIAHRLSTIRNADLILVMKDGDIIESGTHKALMEQNGFYAELYNSQFDQAS